MSSTRRKFLGLSAGAAAAALARPAAGAAQAAPAATPAPSPSPIPAAAAAAAERKPSLLAQAARERYGKYLTEEQLTVLDERMAGLERTSARLRSFKFGNGDEPATDFRVKRSSAAKAEVDK